MKPFTDEDLKRLKQWAGGDPNGDPEGLENTVLDLIARIEAAERYIEFIHDFTIDHDGAKERLEAWKKSAGK